MLWCVIDVVTAESEPHQDIGASICGISVALLLLHPPFPLLLVLTPSTLSGSIPWPLDPYGGEVGATGGRLALGVIGVGRCSSRWKSMETRLQSHDLITPPPLPRFSERTTTRAMRQIRRQTSRESLGVFDLDPALSVDRDAFRDSRGAAPLFKQSFFFFVLC